MADTLRLKNKFFYLRYFCLITFVSACCSVRAIDANESKKKDEIFRDSIIAILDNRNTSMEQKAQIINGLSKLKIEYQLEILLKIKEDISKDAGYNTLVDLYCNIAACYMFTHRVDQAKPYLDMAAEYEQEVADSRVLGNYHHIWGNYYNLTAGGTKSHYHYYKAISCYEKLEGHNDRLISILNNLSFSYIQKDDINNLKKITDKMLSLVDEDKEPSVAVNAYRVAFYYYHSLDRRDDGKVVFGDSAVYYNKKIIDIYEANKGAGFYPEEIAYDYANLANICKSKDIPDYNQVISYIQKARDMANPQDTAMIINANMLEGFSYYEQGHFGLAEPILLQLLDIMNHWSLEEDLSMYVSVYDILMKMSLKKNDYEAALKYEQKKVEYQNKVHDKEKYQTIQDLQVKYEVDKKEQQIVTLQERARYQEQIRLLFIGIFVLTLVASYFVIRWFKTKRKEAELASLLEKEKAQTLAAEIKEKEQEYQSLVGEIQLRQIRSYLEGLEVERSRLAKDLHDNISNELVVLKMRMDNNDITKEVVTQTLENIHKQIRSISHGLMPPVFKYATLPDILEDLTRQQNIVSGTTVSFSVQSDEKWDDFPSGISLEIYRIVQEAVGNALKYAHAASVEVMLMREENHIRLIVEDDGKGFDVQTAKSGIGLRTMKERVESLKGIINIDSVPGKGTEVVIDIELDK